MKLKKLANNAINFGINRVIEICGVAIFMVIFIATSLITFSPDDPNFIFPIKQKLKIFLDFVEVLLLIFFFNLLGYIFINPF